MDGIDYRAIVAILARYENENAQLRRSLDDLHQLVAQREVLADQEQTLELGARDARIAELEQALAEKS